jgi:hypothetical protein
MSPHSPWLVRVSFEAADYYLDVQLVHFLAHILPDSLHLLELLPVSGSKLVASGLTGCNGTSPTEPILEASVDPARTGDQTAIPTEWQAGTGGFARVSTQSSAKPAQAR